MSSRSDSRRSRHLSALRVLPTQVLTIAVLLALLALSSYALAAGEAGSTTGEGGANATTGEGGAGSATGGGAAAPSTSEDGTEPTLGAAAAGTAMPGTGVAPPAPPAGTTAPGVGEGGVAPGGPVGTTPPVTGPGCAVPAGAAATIPSATAVATGRPITLDLAASAQLAAQRNLTIKAAQQDITTATQLRKQARGLAGLAVDLNAAYYHLAEPLTLQNRVVPFDGTELVIPGQVVADQNPYFLHLNARYPLYNFGRHQYNIRSATYRIGEAQESSSDTQLTTILQVTRTYLAAVYGRENVRANEESLRSYQAHLDSARRSRQAGVATDYDVIRAEAAVADQQKRLTDVRNQYAMALDNLRTALAMDKSCPIDLRGGFFELPAQPPVAAAEASALQADPLLRSILDRANSFRMSEKSIRAEGKPQLDLVAFANLLPRDKGYLTSPQWSVGAQVAWALFDTGVIRARAAERGSAGEKAAIEAAGRRDDVTLGVRSAYLDMDTASSAVAASRKSVELATESLRLANRRFQEGVGTSLEVFDANVSLLSAEVSLQQSYYQLDSAYLGLHRYLGDILPVSQCAQGGGVAGTEGGTR